MLSVVLPVPLQLLNPVALQALVQFDAVPPRTLELLERLDGLG